MKTIAGSILILSAAVLLQPVVENQHRLDEAIFYAGPVLIAGIVLLIKGLKSNS